MITESAWGPLESALTVLVSLVGLGLTLVVLVTSVRRALGVRIGWIRAGLVLFLAWGIGLPLSGTLAVALGIARPDGSLMTSEMVAGLFFLAVLAWIFVACLATLIVLEAFMPTGHVPGPREAWTRSVRATRRSVRYGRIIWVGATTGMNAVIRSGPRSEVFGEVFVRFCNRAGVTFVKLGQILATRTDLFPAEFTTAISALQSDADPEPTANIVATVLAEQGVAARELFASFDEVPLGAASVAQVHAATLRDGRDVVVKVQRPGARAQVEVDTDILIRIARTVESRQPWAREMDLSGLASGFSGSLRDELDYRLEARNTMMGAAALSSHADIVVPAVVSELSTRRMLVLERLRGRPLTGEAVAVLDPQRRTALARTLITASLTTILVEGVFHADLHPGNILVLDDQRLGILDFGVIGVLDSETRRLLGGLLLAVLAGDAALATTTLTLAFETRPTLDMGRLRRDLGREITMLRLQDRLDVEAFARVFEVLRAHGIRVPGDAAAAVRTLVNIDGAVRIIDPATSLVEVARTIAPDVMRAQSDLARSIPEMAGTALAVGVVATRLPARLDRITEALDRAPLGRGTRVLHDPDDRRWIGAQITDVLTAGFGMIACVLAVILVLHTGGPMLTPSLSLSALSGAFVGAGGMVLALRTLVRLFSVSGRVRSRTPSDRVG
ncbi:ABC1 kinase family protein [Microbacterium sp. Clip185]|uniref:ABC1 kinase family protein n=1 Tax=Microbacterium sp. Clip185 TaxID=3025663 RepID=UPI0023657ACA|nr:AarF/UbiB family protein [Microbacterium sp. Clip185]WDG19259.1 AarF/UbiB family protein [Microbacterium sp. Clip185]